MMENTFAALMIHSNRGGKGDSLVSKRHFFDGFIP